MRKRLFFTGWLLLAVFLVFISLKYRSRTEAMVAEVESQVTAISYQKPVIIEKLNIFPGQEVRVGDTLLIVSRPDLSLDLERKYNELDRTQSEIKQITQNHESKRALLQIETESKLSRLSTEKLELETKLSQDREISTRLTEMTESRQTTYADSLKFIRIASIDQEIRDLNRYFKKEKEILDILKGEQLEILRKEQELLKLELSSLLAEKQELVKTARFHGTIGTLNVQLDELVPPFKTIVSVYEVRPTLIKAFMNERITYSITPGDSVQVVSENRLYSIGGMVQEIGGRITSYPPKIQPTSDVLSYGQEIFIKIPGENRFLNGEKVFVYPASQE